MLGRHSKFDSFENLTVTPMREPPSIAQRRNHEIRGKTKSPALEVYPQVCQLRWDWEIQVPELDTSVFVVPAQVVKNKEDRLVVLNPIARSLVKDQRGVHPSRVFTYHGRPVGNMYNSAWKRARIAAAKAHAQAHGEPISWGFANLRVHDLKHTFGRRLRAAGVSLETRKVLLGHTYSSPEIEELLAAAKHVCEMNSRKTPALTILKRKTG